MLRSAIRHSGDMALLLGRAAQSHRGSPRARVLVLAKDMRVIMKTFRRYAEDLTGAPYRRGRRRAALGRLGPAVPHDRVAASSVALGVALEALYGVRNGPLAVYVRAARAWVSAIAEAVAELRDAATAGGPS